MIITHEPVIECEDDGLGWKWCLPVLKSNEIIEGNGCVAFLIKIIHLLVEGRIVAEVDRVIATEAVVRTLWLGSKVMIQKRRHSILSIFPYDRVDDPDAKQNEQRSGHHQRCDEHSKI